MFKKILVPFNGSGLADGILPFVPQFAEGFGSSVIMLWVMEPNSVRSDDASILVDLEEAARQLALEVGDVEPMVTVGSPAPAIARIAAEEGCDLIAMTTHGRGMFGRGFFGSVADEVIRYSPIPVMVFAPRKADKEWGEDGKIERIVVPLDGSPDAEIVLPFVEEMARRMNLELIFIRVKEPTVSGVALPISVLMTAVNVETGEKEYMESVTRRLQDEGVRARWELLDGNLGYRAATFARKTSHNMVALANRGHSGIERWIEGSFSELLILGSGDPVLIIPPPEEDAQME